MVTSTIVAVPIFALMDRNKLDSTYGNMYDTRDMKDLLEYAPMARNALYEALETNLRFQKSLKKKITEIESRKKVEVEEKVEDEE